MANKFWNDRALDPYGQPRYGWILAIALGVLLGIYAASCGEDNQPEAQDRELHFYQIDPPCRDAAVGYILLSGKLYTEEHHRIYVCGYHR